MELVRIAQLAKVDLDHGLLRTSFDIVVSLVQWHANPLDRRVHVPSLPADRNPSPGWLNLLLLVVSRGVRSLFVLVLLQKFSQHWVLMLLCDVVLKHVFSELFAALSAFKQLFWARVVHVQWKVSLLDPLSTVLRTHHFEFVYNFVKTHVGFETDW